MKKLVIFDLDGTLLYTIDDICFCLNIVLKNNGYKTFTPQETLPMVGYGAKILVEKATGESGEVFERLFKEYVDVQEQCDNSKTRLYDGLDEVLINLKKGGYKLAIVSNKPDIVTQPVVKEKLSKYGFDYVMGNNAKLFAPKPDKSCVEYCLKTLNISKEDAVYVGDSEVDVKTFRNAGVDGIGVTWGYRKKHLLEENGCVNFADNPNELYKIIKEM